METAEYWQLEFRRVDEQCRVSHQMAVSWKVRCLRAEKECRTLQKKLDRLQRKQTSQIDALPLVDDDGTVADLSL
jgi:hypothetical protein